MEAKKVMFQILFTSDIHGAFRDYDYAADKETNTGFSRIATLIKQERSNFNGKTFVCDCGDNIQGNGTREIIRQREYKPYPLFAAFDEVGYDFVVLGNHEFNFGIDDIYACFEGYKGVKLCGNVFKKDNGGYLDGFKPYVIYTVPDGPRVAFIGMVSPNIEIWDKANMNNAEIYSTDAAEETKKIIEKLTKENLADIFVAAEHMDEISELDRKGSGANEVTKENPQLAVFLGAHYHTIKGAKDKQHILCGGVKFAENLNAGRSYGKVLITASLKDGRWEIENKTGEYETPDTGVKTDIICPMMETPNDPFVTEVTEDAHKFISNYMRTTTIGYLKGGALIPPPEIKGTHEGILSNNALITLITRIMLLYSGADIAAAALNSYDANCGEGKITAGKVIQTYVYDNNTLYKLKMKGRQILQWMEWSYAFFGIDLNPGKPAVNPETDLTIPYGTRKVYLHDQFAGINYTVDLTKPTGSRIKVHYMKNGERFDLDRCYAVVTTNYRAETNLLIATAEGIFKPGEETAEIEQINLKSPKDRTNMLDWIEEYIKGQNDCTIYNWTEANWKFVNLNWDMDLRKRAVELVNNGTIDDYDYRKPVTKNQVFSLS